MSVVRFRGSHRRILRTRHTASAIPTSPAALSAPHMSGEKTLAACSVSIIVITSAVGVADNTLRDSVVGAGAAVGTAVEIFAAAATVSI